MWVGAAGLISMGVVTLVVTFLDGGFPRGGFWMAPVVFGVMANLCYLLGPATEIVIQALWGRQVLPTGPALFRIGLTFSVGLALFPALLAVIALVVTGVVGLF
jgi:hypothetical protein